MKEQNWGHYLRAQESIAQAALTNSKRAECFVKNIYQTHAYSAQGPFIKDVSGKMLFDFICGMGSMLVGHGDHQIAVAIYQRATEGITLSLSSAIEIQLAEKIKEIVPFVQSMKFLKTGTEACMAAVKIARAKTLREHVLSDGYHGWSDEFVSLTPPALGCQKHKMPALHKLSGLEQINRQTAAVIVEPVMTDFSEKRKKYLIQLKEACDKYGVLLIFDEVITGFRFPKFTVSQFWGIEPDIIILGKAMGGGLPISCVAGKNSVMNCGEYFVSSTFAGETCSIAASLSLINQLQTNKFNIAELWEKGAYFQREFNLLWPDKIKLEGYPTRAVFKGDDYTKALLWQEAYQAGILFGSSFFFSFAHMPYVDRILNLLSDIIVRIKTGTIELRGEMPVSPFAQKQREAK